MKRRSAVRPSRLVDGEAGAFQQLPQQDPDVLVVVDDEDLAAARSYVVIRLEGSNTCGGEHRQPFPLESRLRDRGGHHCGGCARRSFCSR